MAVLSSERVAQIKIHAAATTSSSRHDFQEFSKFHRPRRQSAGHCWRLSIQRHVRPTEVVRREENRLHGRVKLQRLGESVRQSRESSHLHSSATTEN